MLRNLTIKGGEIIDYFKYFKVTLTLLNSNMPNEMPSNFIKGKIQHDKTFTAATANLFLGQIRLGLGEIQRQRKETEKQR